MKSNTELMQKAISDTTLPHSILNRQQADAWIDLTVEQSTLLKKIRVEKVNFPKGEIDKLEIANIVTESAKKISGTSANTYEPTESVVNYDSEKLRSSFDITSDWEEDNISGPTKGRAGIVNMFAKAVANDQERLAFNGNGSLAVSSAGTNSREDNLYCTNDGFLKILELNVPAAQQIDAGGSQSSKDLFYHMKRILPSKYKKMTGEYSWILSPTIVDKYEYDLTGRATNLGDKPMDTGYRQFRPFGIDYLACPLLPEDLTSDEWGSTMGTTATGNRTVMLLTPLKNLIFFVQREVKREWDRKPRSDKWEVTIHTRTDYAVENYNMVVLAYNVSTDINAADYAL